MHILECATETSRLTMVEWMTWQSIWTLPCTKILWSRRIRHRLPETSSPVQNSTKMRMWYVPRFCLPILWHSITSRFLSHFYWGRILEMRNNITKTRRFPVMGKVVKAMLTVPNSNAECERAFSMVKKIRTETRANLDNKTICALLTTKVNNIQHCNLVKPSKELLQSAKKGLLVL